MEETVGSSPILPTSGAKGFDRCMKFDSSQTENRVLYSDKTKNVNAHIDASSFTRGVRTGSRINYPVVSFKLHEVETEFAFA